MLCVACCSVICYFKVLRNLPPSLRAELLDKLYREELSNLPLFRSMAEVRDVVALFAQQREWTYLFDHA